MTRLAAAVTFLIMALVFTHISNRAGDSLAGYIAAMFVFFAAFLIWDFGRERL